MSFVKFMFPLALSISVSTTLNVRNEISIESGATLLVDGTIVVGGPSSIVPHFCLTPILLLFFLR